MFFNKFIKGYTLAEIIIAAGLLTMVAAATTKLMVDMQTNNVLLESVNLIKSSDQVGLNRMGRIISASKMFFTRIPEASYATKYRFGEAYLALIDLPSSFERKGYKFVPLNGSFTIPVAPPNSFSYVKSSRVLPELNPNMSFSPMYKDSTNLETKFKPTAVGNTLFFAAYQDEYTYVSADKKVTRSLDLLQFYYYYLGKRVNTTRKDENGKDFIDLIEWRSKYYFDYDQIDGLLDYADINKTDFATAIKVAKAINTPQIPIVGIWNCNYKKICSTDRYFYNLIFNTSTGFFNGNNCSYKIEMYEQTSPLRAFGEEGAIHYGVVRNKYVKGTTTLKSLEIKQKNVPLFADQTAVSNLAGSDDYPHGFEVMINGSTGARKIFIRLYRAGTKGSVSLENETVAVFQGKDN